MSRRTRKSTTTPSTTSTGSIEYHKRDDDGPVNIMDFLDRHIARATADGKTLSFYLILMIVPMLGLGTLAAGVLIAVHAAGLSPWLTLGVGLLSGGGGAAMVTKKMLGKQNGGLQDAPESLDSSKSGTFPEIGQTPPGSTEP